MTFQNVLYIVLGIFLFLVLAYLVTQPKEDTFAGLLLKIFFLIILMTLVYNTCSDL